MAFNSARLAALVAAAPATTDAVIAARLEVLALVEEELAYLAVNPDEKKRRADDAVIFMRARDQVLAS